MPRTMQTNWEMILKGTTDKHQVMMMKDKKSHLCKRYRGLDLYKISKHRRSCKWSHREEELYGFISFSLPELQGWRISWN